MLFCHGHGRFSSSSTSAGSGLFWWWAIRFACTSVSASMPLGFMFPLAGGPTLPVACSAAGTFESQVGDASWESVRILHNQRNVVRLEQGGDPCQFNSQSGTDVDCSSSAVALLQSEGRLTRDSGSGSTLSCQICQIQSAS